MVRPFRPPSNAPPEPCPERPVSLRLQGRVVLVAGDEREAEPFAGRIAAALADGGADVALAPPRHRISDAVHTLAHVEAAGRRGLVVAGDLNDPLSCRHVVAEVVRALGRLDVVVDVGDAPRGRVPARPAATFRHDTGVTVVDPSSAKDADAVARQLVEDRRIGVAWSQAAWTRLMDDVRSGATALKNATLRLHDRVLRTEVASDGVGFPTYVHLPREQAAEAAEGLVSLIEAHRAGAAPVNDRRANT